MTETMNTSTYKIPASKKENQVFRSNLIAKIELDSSFTPAIKVAALSLIGDIGFGLIFDLDSLMEQGEFLLQNQDSLHLDMPIFRAHLDSAVRWVHLQLSQL